MADPKQMIFALSPVQEGGHHVLVLGIPASAWDYIKTGQTNTFDLRRAGVPLQLIVFGATTYEEGQRLIKQFSGPDPTLDVTRDDFGIKHTRDLVDEIMRLVKMHDNVPPELRQEHSLALLEKEIRAVMPPEVGRKPAEYSEPVPEYGDLMTVALFRQRADSGLIGNDDGHGCPVKDGRMMRVDVKPSGLDMIPVDATHVVWFNK